MTKREHRMIVMAHNKVISAMQQYLKMVNNKAERIELCAQTIIVNDEHQHFKDKLNQLLEA